MDTFLNVYFWICSFGMPAILAVHIVPAFVILGMIFCRTEPLARRAVSSSTELAYLPESEPAHFDSEPTEVVLRVEHHHYHHHEVTHRHVMEGRSEPVRRPPAPLNPPMIVPGVVLPSSARKELRG